MTLKLPSKYCLSIAGFDPSAGAGVLSDVKTFEANGIYGFGVVSALTWQNDKEFDKVEWLDIYKIISQVDVLLRRFEIKYVKIGLIENMHVLQQLIAYLRKQMNQPVIIYDPILKASAGHVFHRTNSEEFLNAIDGVYCITPNIPEANNIFGEESLNETLEQLSETVNVYLKGGHANDTVVTDLLYTHDHTYAYSNDHIPGGEKHGSGCVLSAALTAQLALGNDIAAAAEHANTYTHHFLASSNTLLGHHKTITNELHQ